MEEFLSEEQGAKGVARAIELYGRPLERSLTYQVSEETFQYWEEVRRKRVAEVVILLRRPNGRYLAHTKAFYPKGVYRLLSGGIKMDEDLLAAVRREAYEETGLDVHIQRFLGILRYQFVWQQDGSPESHSLPFTSYLFALAEEGGTLETKDPKEAISDYREVTLSGISALVEQLESLPADWADWGRFRAAAHRLVVEVLAQQETDHRDEPRIHPTG